MTQYRSTLEKVVGYATKYNLTGTQLNTVYKILTSLKGI